MSKFIRSIVVEVDFQDQKAVITCRPLSRKDALVVRPLNLEADGDLSKAFDIFVPNVVSVTGLTDADGQAITLEDFTQSAFFMAPMIRVFSEWIKRSSPSAKN